MTATPPPLSDEQHAAIRNRFERTTHPGWRSDTDMGRLLAEVDRLHNELAAAGNQIRRIATQATAEEDRLRAENEAMRAVQRVHVAGFEAALLIADRDPDATTSSGARHEAIGYNAALSDVRDAIVPAAAPTATSPNGCGCQTATHPGHWPGCPTRATAPTATT
jgi:hypothetical protein